MTRPPHSRFQPVFYFLFFCSRTSAALAKGTRMTPSPSSPCSMHTRQTTCIAKFPSSHPPLPLSPSPTHHLLSAQVGGGLAFLAFFLLPRVCTEYQRGGACPMEVCKQPASIHLGLRVEELTLPRLRHRVESGVRNMRWTDRGNTPRCSSQSTDRALRRETPAITRKGVIRSGPPHRHWQQLAIVTLTLHDLQTSVIALPNRSGRLMCRPTGPSP